MNFDFTGDGALARRERRLMSRNFGDIFDAAMKTIKADAAALGLTLDEVCALAKVSRTTPFRYGKKRPQTITTIVKLQTAIEAKRAERRAAVRA